MNKILACFFTTVLIISSIYSQEEKKNVQIKNFKDKYAGDLSIQWDKFSGGPKKIIGNNIYLKSNLVNKTNINALTKDFINENGDLLNTRNTELASEDITEFNNKFIITYQQLYKKIPLWNVKLKLKIAKNGQVLMIKSPCFDNPSVPVQPKITTDEAKKNAVANFNTDIKEVMDCELLIYPQRETGKLYLCWHIKIENGINKGIMIDAQTGQKIFDYDLYRNAEIRGTVRTTTWSLPGQLGGVPDITPYSQDLNVNVTGIGSSNTNSFGYYCIIVPSEGNYTVTSNLDGPHCFVTNYRYAGPGATYSNSASTSSDHNWTWQESAHYNEYFVFYYMNNAWNEFNDKVSGFSSNYWYSNKMEGWANEDFQPGHANGYASGTKISFTPLNHFGCSVYHEYSHNVNFRNNGFWLGSNWLGDGNAMDEGFADYYSCSLRNDPLRYAVDRRLDTKMKYPGSGESHIRGQIIGGACWDLGNKSGMSHNYVNALVYEAIHNLEYEETFGDLMDEILSADDDDGNIFNGTPHDEQICDAFINDHNIIGSYLIGDISDNIVIDRSINVIGNTTVLAGKTVTINSGVTLSFSLGAQISVNGTLTAVGTSANHITFDRIGASGSWGGIVFNSGSSGSVEYCNISHATTGITCSSTLPMIRHNTISNNTTGIYVSNVSTPSNEISYNTIQNNTSRGINLYSASPKI